ncbi:MAG: phosphatase PAP2 family protein, partial [Bradyrhizobiaceae bacterium]|nr:phosphatase PAP2 family protein [Bradyrhizobiaceae bacterium]
MIMPDAASDDALHRLAKGARHFISVIVTWIAVLLRPARGRLPALAFIKERQHLRVGTVAAVIVVPLLMRWADEPLIQIAERLPSSMQETFNAITDFGRSGWVLWPSGILILITAAAATRAATRMARLVLATVAVRFGYVFLAVGIPGLFVTIVKRWIGRVRPSQAGPFAYHPFSWDPAYASLPSGHAAAAFSALIAIGAIFPRARPVLWVYAITIAVSRVIISAHYPSDVVAGAAVGAIGAI